MTTDPRTEPRTEPRTDRRPDARTEPRTEPLTEPLPRVARSTPEDPTAPHGHAGPAEDPDRSPAGPEPEAAPRRLLTVRTRIVAVVVATTVAALALSGLTAALLTTSRVDARVDDDLTRSAGQVRVLASDGVDPRTGAPFASAHDLVARALSRTVPAPRAGMLAIEDGRVALVAADSVRVRPEDDAQLVAALARPGVADRPALRSITTATTTWRVAVVPVQAVGASDDASTFVLAYDRGAEQRDFSGPFAIYAVVAALAAALVALVGWVVAGRLLRPVRDLGTTARAITRTDLTARLPVTGNDDVADLTRAFNAMLDRIEQAVDAQRALLDDVGHELRTPLTVVRGHLEVMDADDAVDVAETRELTLDELDRMSRMVSDLMTLATAGDARFVRPAPTDLGALADSVSGNVRPLGDRRWGVQERAEGTALVDAQRLTQAWLQLAANAVKFSDPGSTIVLGSRVTPAGMLELWVRDEGVGISPDQLDRVFTRFARVDEDDARPGAGLGLAIVAAIAHAHGGHVEVASLRGRGSTFTVRVPVGGPAGGPATGPAGAPAQDHDEAARSAAATEGEQ